MDKKTLVYLALAVVLLMTANGLRPRGIRNNNPGNIRSNPANPWRGQIGVDGAGFVVFDSVENGVRAMARILSSYANRGLVSVRDIISTWAPASENNTNAYIASVAGRLGLDPGEPVPPEKRPALIGAIIYHENGQQPYSAATIEKGVSLA